MGYGGEFIEPPYIPQLAQKSINLREGIVLIAFYRALTNPEY